MTKPSPLKMMWIKAATDVKIFKELTFIRNFLERKGSCQVCMKFANLQRNSSIFMNTFFSVAMEEYLNTSIQVQIQILVFKYFHETFLSDNGRGLQVFKNSIVQVFVQ